MSNKCERPVGENSSRILTFWKSTDTTTLLIFQQVRDRFEQSVVLRYKERARNNSGGKSDSVDISRWWHCPLN